VLKSKYGSCRALDTRTVAKHESWCRDIRKACGDQAQQNWFGRNKVRFFLKDKWLRDTVLVDRYPRLYMLDL